MVRNPYDNIATMTLRSLKIRTQDAHAAKNKVSNEIYWLPNSQTVENSYEHFFVLIGRLICPRKRVLDNYDNNVSNNFTQLKMVKLPVYK